MYRCRHIILFVLFQLIVLQVSAQNTRVDSLRNSAKDYFENGDYLSALPYAERLLSLFPADGRYLYQTGVCLSKVSLDIPRAYELLKVASLKNVSPEVYYYLGDLSRRLYRFDEAIEWFRQYMVSAGSKEYDKTVVERQVTMCENGSYLTKYAADLTVLGQAKTTPDSLLYYYTVSPGSGELGSMPIELASKLDRKKSSSTPFVVYYPSSEGNEPEVIYFSSYGKTEIHGKNLWRTNKTASGEWEQPTELSSSINTDGDEAFPIPAQNGGVLYFASNALYGMGGYDIFKATFDATKGEWGIPENLGFPINSPADDYFFVPDRNGETAMFASNRNCVADSVVVYKVVIPKSGINQSVVDIDEKLALARLDITRLNTDKSNIKESATDAPNARVEGLQYDLVYMRLMSSLTSLRSAQDSIHTQLDALRVLYQQSNNSSTDSIKSKIVMLEERMRNVTSNIVDVNREASQMEEDYLSQKKHAEDLSDVPTSNAHFLCNKKVVEFLGHNRVVAMRRLCATVTAMDSSFYSSLELLRQEHDLIIMLTAADQQPLIQKINTSLANVQSKELLAPSEYLGKRALMSVGLHNLFKESILSVSMNAEQSNSFQMANADMVSAQAIFNNNPNDAPTLDTYEGIRDGLWLEERGLLRYQLVVAQILELSSIDSLTMQVQKLEHRGAIPFYVFEQPKTKEVIPSLKPQAKPAAAKSVKLKQDYSVGLQVVDPYPYSSQSPIPFDQPFPAGVIYKIQLGAFSQPVNFYSFKGLAPITGENLKGGTIKKYFAGIFYTLTEAQAGLVLAKSRGLTDAFLVGWLNGKVVPLARAQNFEERKSIEGKAFQPNSEISGTEDKNIYRVIIGTFEGALPSRIQPVLNEFARNKEVAKKVIAEKTASFSVGNFVNFEEALRLKDALLSNGFVEAYVTKVKDHD